MNFIPTLETSLVRYKEADASVQYMNTYNGMVSSTNFPSPDIAYSVYKQAGIDYSNSLVAGKRKKGVPTAVKKSLRKKLNAYYKTQALYVIRICNGDLINLHSSNFVVIVGKAIRALEAFVVTNTKKPGEVFLRVLKVAKARSYYVQCRVVSDTAPNEWVYCKILGCTSGKCDGLISGVEYEFRMRVIFSKTESDWYNSFILRVG